MKREGPHTPVCPSCFEPTASLRTPAPMTRPRFSYRSQQSAPRDTLLRSSGAPSCASSFPYFVSFLLPLPLFPSAEA